MFGRFLKREKSRLFLGTLAVVPRTDAKLYFDQNILLGRPEFFDNALLATLEEVFSLPPAVELTDPKPSDLALDVFITAFQSGEFQIIDLEWIGFPIFWRPKITVVCRLYYLKSQETKNAFSVTQKVSWHYFLSRVFSWRALSRFNKPLFDAEDMNKLLYCACHSMLNKLRKAMRGM